MRAFAVLIPLLLIGCQSEADKAADRLHIVEKTGDKRQICDASREVASAYLRQGDEAKYRDADLAAKINCQSADLAL